MRITKQEEYGLRCILQLAQTEPKVPMPVEEIALKEGLSVDYVTKLLIMLRRKGLVQSVRGMRGGYVLARSPEKISVGEVLYALGWTFIDEEICQHYPGKLSECIHLKGCGIRPIWVSVAKIVYDVMNRTSLASLTQEEQLVGKEIELKLNTLNNS